MSSQSKAVVSGNTLSISRILNAPRELVWSVWTNPEHVINWWGPVGFTTTSDIMNVAPGGEWKFTMHGPDGRDYLNKVIFIEVVKPEKLIYKHAGDGETEHIRFHVTVTFTEQNGNTKLDMESVFDSAEELQKVQREHGAVEGLEQTVGRLEEYLIKISGGVQ